MACPGSANLELAIPGYVEPVRDDMAGAKGMGTNVHSCLEICTSGLPEQLLSAMQALLVDYAELHWTKRRPIVETEAAVYDWILKQGHPILHANTEPTWINEAINWFMLLGQSNFPPSMLRFIADAMLYMADLVASYSSTDSTIYGELQMEAVWLDSKPNTTADAVLDRPGHLDVVDYKSGKIPVDVVENDQLMFYAVTAYEALNSYADVVTVHILQPGGNFVSWTVTANRLKEWKDKARETDRKIMSKDLTLVPNDHCTYCPANPHTRGDKANKMCPVMLAFLYPPSVDMDEMLDM
jgi:hypothetical protein